MVRRMRTTLTIDDDVLRGAKRQASERGITLSDLVTEALRASVTRATFDAPAFSMITYGDPTYPIRYGPPDFEAALEREDAERLKHPAERVVLLDRDGTVVIDREYLADPAGLEFLRGAAEGLRRLHQGG